MQQLNPVEKDGACEQITQLRILTKLQEEDGQAGKMFLTSGEVFILPIAQLLFFSERTYIKLIVTFIVSVQKQLKILELVFFHGI